MRTAWANPDWLERQAKKAGFAVSAVAGVPLRLARKQKRGPDLDRSLGKPDIPHFGVRFDGSLVVTEPEALGAAVRDGVGPAKAFGFGLLPLGPA